LYKSWSSEVGRGHNRENHILNFILKKNLLQNQQANFNKPWYKSSFGKKIKIAQKKGQNIAYTINDKPPNFVIIYVASALRERLQYKDIGTIYMSWQIQCV
jgi:hypothetical protein